MRHTHFVNTGTPPGLTRQIWIDSFKGKKVELHLLCTCGEVRMYLTKDPPGDPYPRKPVYHVWKGDRWLYCGQSAEKAQNVFDKNMEQ